MWYISTLDLDSIQYIWMILSFPTSYIFLILDIFGIYQFLPQEIINVHSRYSIQSFLILFATKLAFDFILSPSFFTVFTHLFLHPPPLNKLQALRFSVYLFASKKLRFVDVYKSSVCNSICFYLQILCSW